MRSGAMIAPVSAAAPALRNARRVGGWWVMDGQPLMHSPPVAAGSGRVHRPIVPVPPPQSSPCLQYRQRSIVVLCMATRGFPVSAVRTLRFPGSHGHRPGIRPAEGGRNLRPFGERMTSPALLLLDRRPVRHPRSQPARTNPTPTAPEPQPVTPVEPVNPDRAGVGRPLQQRRVDRIGLAARPQLEHRLRT